MDKTQFTFLFWAYFVAWAGVLLYVGSLVARERKLRRQLESLQQQLKDSDDV
ncbi:MAG: CcmD family protein [Bryobacterales bacterium]|jgi:CcmD family protein|nr:CcmD family protein [Bryobacterales bacterium]